MPRVFRSDTMQLRRTPPQHRPAPTQADWDADLIRPLTICFKFLFAASPVATAIATLAEGRFIEANPAFLELHGYARDEVIGHTAHELQLWSNPAERDQVVALVQRLGYARNFAHEYRCKSGRVGCALGSVHRIQIDGLACLLRFITDFDDLDDALQSFVAREHQAQAVFDNMLNGFARCRMLFDDGRPADFVFLHTNPAFESQTGLKDVMGRRASEVVPGIREKDPALMEFFGRIARGGPAEKLELFVASLQQWFAFSAYCPGPDQFIAVFDVVTERKRAEQELETYREHLEKLVEQRTQSLAETYRQLVLRSEEVADLYNHAPCGYHSLDADGKVSEVNETELAMLGYAREEFVGHHIAEFMTEEGKALLRSNFPKLQRNGQRANLEFEFICRDGSTLPVVVSANAVRDAQGQFRISRSTVMDNRARKAQERAIAQMQAELVRRADAAEAANVAKSAFLANMSHEIRTPLNAISGMAYLIRREGLNPTQSDQMAKLESAAKHLLSIINAVLDLSKIEAGKFKLDQSPIKVDALLDNVATMLRGPAQAKQLDLKVQAEALPDEVLGDATRLQQALLNLGNNAAKFTSEGGITIRAYPVEEGADDVLLRFEVEDTGVGIEAEALARLFAPFEQADNSMTRQHGGTGLGLAITKRLAQLMGGDAGATSRPGIGSKFWFTVRLRKAQAARPDPVPEEGEAAKAVLKRDFAGRRVLVVDDEPINREITLMLLDLAGQSSEVAKDGLEAVELAARNHYDLILMDLLMPNLDGLEATRRIRQLPRCARVPILAMTASAFSEDKAKCLEAGMNDFITKPIRPELLYETMLAWLARAGENPD